MGFCANNSPLDFLFPTNKNGVFAILIFEDIFSKSRKSTEGNG